MNKTIYEMVENYENTTLWYDVDRSIDEIACEEKQLFDKVMANISIMCMKNQLSAHYSEDIKKLLQAKMQQRSEMVQRLVDDYNGMSANMRKIYRMMCEKKDSVRYIVKMIENIKTQDFATSDLLFKELLEAFVSQYPSKGAKTLILAAYEVKEEEVKKIEKKNQNMTIQEEEYLDIDKEIE